MNSCLHYIGFTLGLLLIVALDKSCAQTYRAAVVAYKPERNLRDIPSEILERNKERYVHLMEEVKDKADIIIFPENGLTTNEPNSKSRIHLESYSIVVPDVPTNPCFNVTGGATKLRILDGLSCAAKSSGLYVVCNVVEKFGQNEEMKFYSTSVVFDSEGNLILKCRKKYPFPNTNFDKGDPGQNCVFEAKFKNNNVVKFALLFDTDLIHELKEDINHVILTSSIKNVLPITSALSVQVGYSVRNKVNLLASGYVDLNQGYGGSGIYLRNGTSKVAVNSDTIINEIPIKDTVIKEVNVNVNPPELPGPVLYNITEDKNLDLLNSTEPKTDVHLARTDFCKFKMNMTGNDISPYRWAGYITDSIKYMGQDIRLLVCGLIKPKSQINAPTIFGLTITMKVRSDEVIQMIPISLQANMLPTNFRFELVDADSSSDLVQMSLTKNADLYSFGIVVVLRDVKPSSSSSLIHASHIFTVGFFSMFLVLMYGKEFIFSL